MFDLEPDEVAELDLYPRPVRLILKRAYASTQSRPLLVIGVKMEQAVRLACKLGLTVYPRAPDRGAIALSEKGFRFSQHLRRSGWPNCEKGS